MTAGTAEAASRLGCDTRRQLRLPIVLRGRIGNSQFGKRMVDLTDISTRGCCIAAPFQWLPGTRLVLAIPTLAPMAVTVRWRTNAAAGFTFDKSLHPSVVDYVLAMARTPGEAPVLAD